MRKEFIILTTVPAGYFWCYAAKFPRTEGKGACKNCSKFPSCGRIEIDAIKDKIFEVSKKLKRYKPVQTTAPIKKKSKEEKRREENESIKKLLDKYTKPQVKFICGECKKSLDKERTYWAYDGVRWIRNVAGKWELS